MPRSVKIILDLVKNNDNTSNMNHMYNKITVTVMNNCIDIGIHNYRMANDESTTSISSTTTALLYVRAKSL